LQCQQLVCYDYTSKPPADGDTVEESILKDCIQALQESFPKDHLAIFMVRTLQIALGLSLMGVQCVRINQQLQVPSEVLIFAMQSIVNLKVQRAPLMSVPLPTKSGNLSFFERSASCSLSGRPRKWLYHMEKYLRFWVEINVQEKNIELLTQTIIKVGFFTNLPTI
jgi:hypothetical protein